MNKELEIKMKIAGVLARPELNLLDRSKKLTDIYEVLEQQLILSGVSHRRELFILFADWLQYNGKWMLPKDQVKEFFKQQKETK